MKMKNMLRKAISLLCVIALLVTNLVFIKASEVQASENNLTEIGWNDFSGAEVGKTYSTAWKKFTYNDTSVTTLNNTKFVGQIQFSDNSGIRYGGSAESFGLHIYVKDGKLGLKSDTFTLSDDLATKTFEAAQFGITSGTFANTPFMLTITMTDVTTTTATVGVWVNDIAVDESFTITENGVWNASLGNTICIMDGNYTGSVTIPKPLPPTDLTEIGWADFGITSDTTYADYAYVTYADGESLDGTLFSGDIMLTSTTDGISEIRYAARADGWVGLHVCVAANGWFYLVTDTNYTDIISGKEYLANGSKYYYASDFGLGDSFSGEKFNLKISTEVEGDEYTFGVWINDIMVGNYFTLAEPATSSGSRNQIGFDMNQSGNVTVYLEKAGYTDITWEDFEGAEYGKTYSTAWDKFTYKDTTATTLNNTRFTGKIQFSEMSGIRYGGSNESFGLHLSVQNGKLVLRSDTFTLDNFEMMSQDASHYGITTGTFADAVFDLTITMADVTSTYAVVGVWVNGIAVDEEFTMTSNGLWGASLGTSICIFDGNDVFAGGTVTIPGDEPGVEPEPDVPSEPIAPPTDLTEIGWADFGITSDTTYADYAYVTYADGESLDGTLFSGDIKMGSSEPSQLSEIRYAASGDGSHGLHICVENGLLYLVSHTMDIVSGSEYLVNSNVFYSASDFGAGDSFSNVKFNLKISTEIEGDNYTFGVWINDEMLGGYFTLTPSSAYPTAGGNQIGLDINQAGFVEVYPEEVVYTDYTDITWEDFEGAEYGKTYSTAWDKFTYKDTTATTLNNTRFTGKIQFSEMSGIRYGGSNESFGLHLSVQNGKLVLRSDTFTLDNFEMMSQDASHYGITTGTFADAEFELTITMTAVTSTYATVGVWVNGIAVDEEFTMTSNGLWGASLGTSICIFDGNDVFAGGMVTIPGDEPGVEPEPDVPSEPITPPTDFTTITLDDFGGQIEPMALGSNTPISGQLESVNSYDRTLFDVDIDIATQTPGNQTYIRFGGEAEGWVGISVQTSDSGNLCLVDTRRAQAVETYNVKTAKVDFYKTQFNLKVSFEYVDSDEDGSKDDVKVGVYFNNVLYNNKYTYFKDFAMTKWLLAYTDDGTIHPFRLRVPGEKDPEPIAPPTDLKVITFSSFGIDDADFTEIDTTNFCAKGQYRDMVKGTTLDGTLFHGKVKFSTIEGCQIRYGGLETPWLGLILGTANEDMVALWEAEMNLPEKEIAVYFMESEAGTTLTGEWLDLKMSTEFVDYDGDGKKDDVKFGIWFNDRMYRNNYYYFVDYAPHMGSYMCIYSWNEESHISIRSAEIDENIDLGFYGFVGDYRKWFSAEGEYVAEGEPLGVTVEYDTVDYELDTAVGKIELKDMDTVTDAKNPIIPIVVWIAAIIMFAAIAVFLIVFFVKKRNKGGMKG